MKKLFKQTVADIPASVVVFLVALPLCLGVAQASNPIGQNLVPMLGGILAGVVGGIVVGILSGSQLSVSGPAAGLTAIVGGAIGQLGSYETFLLCVIIAGVIQIIMGFLKAGIIGDYVPNSVIKGMLAAIGLILILKQIPHLLGQDLDPAGDETFIQPNKQNTFTSLWYAVKFLTPSATIIGAVCLLVMMLWETKFIKSIKILGALPGALIVVLLGTLINEFFISVQPMYALEQKHLVSLPIAANAKEFFTFLKVPDIKGLNNPHVWTSAFTLAIVASLETLLGIEAVDKLDTKKRITPTNKELIAQGTGNIVSGLIGGLPITSVVVRSSANVTAGASTKMSTILHGVLLLLSVLFIPFILNHIPLSALAAVLIYTGYKLAKISLFKAFFDKGWDQFVPFTVTILAILFTDLLRGIGIGIFVGLFYMMRSNFRSSIFVVNDKNNYLIRLRKDVSFLNKPIIKRKLDQIPNGAYLIIDATRADFIDKDIIEEVNNFLVNAPTKRIKVEVKKSLHKPMHLLFNQPNN